MTVKVRRWLGALVGVALAYVGVYSCSRWQDNRDLRHAVAAASASNASTQAGWGKAYTETTCRDWALSMTDLQRLTGAQVMLNGERWLDHSEMIGYDADGNPDVQATGYDPAGPELVAQFDEALTTACAMHPNAIVSSAAANLYYGSPRWAS